MWLVVGLLLLLARPMMAQPADCVPAPMPVPMGDRGSVEAQAQCAEGLVFEGRCGRKHPYGKSAEPLIVAWVQESDAVLPIVEAIA